MSSGYVISVDPNEMAARFAAAQDPRYDEEDDVLDPDEIENVSTEEADLLFAGENFEEKIQPYLDRIPEMEADFIWLYYIQRKKQRDIAHMFKITQAAVSYRLNRGLKRIQFLLSIPQVPEDELREILPDLFPQIVKDDAGNERLIDVEILVWMGKLTCQTAVARQLGYNQGRVRHRFFNAVDKLKEAAESDPDRYGSAAKAFSTLADKNFNILREVKLPQWQDRGGNGCV